MFHTKMTPKTRPTPSALKWLAEKRARVAGDLEQALFLAVELTQHADKLRDDLAALDRTVRIYDSKIDPETIEPIYAWKGHYGQRGALRGFVLTFLKGHAPEAISSGNIEAMVHAQFGLTFATPLERRRWYDNSFRGVLKKLVTDGLVERVVPANQLDKRDLSWRFIGEGAPTLDALTKSATRAAGARAVARS